MSKPIFIVRFPESTPNQQLESAREHLSIEFDDYHSLVIKDQFTGGEIKFECYNAPHTEMEFKELQERVITLLQNQK